MEGVVMRTIVQYKTVDGRQFDTEDEARSHEALLLQIENALKPLGNRRPTEEGWIQHSQTSVLAAKRSLLSLATQTCLAGFPDVVEKVNADPDSVHPRSIVGRIMDDSNSPINKGWYRIMCIDDSFREHSQPFYAINGPLAEHKQL